MLDMMKKYLTNLLVIVKYFFLTQPRVSEVDGMHDFKSNL